MSSPKMTRMLGFPPCVWAKLGVAMTTETRSAITNGHHVRRIMPLSLGRVVFPGRGTSGISDPLPVCERTAEGGDRMETRPLRSRSSATRRPRANIENRRFDLILERGYYRCGPRLSTWHEECFVRS